MNDKIIKIVDLSFSYGNSNNNILKNIFLEFETNNITGILGRNGSGKTTLLECIMRLNNNYNGQILLYGQNIQKYSINNLSKIIAYLPQIINKEVEFKVLDYLLFGRAPYLSINSLPNSDDYEKVYMYAKKIGIEELLYKNFNQLSGGEKQLVRIARTLVQETDMIILDEPTAALDFGNQHKILQILSLLGKEGKTIVFTIHNPNQLIEYNFNVVVLNNSTIIAKGLAKKIIDNIIIKNVYGENYVVENGVCQLKK